MGINSAPKPRPMTATLNFLLMQVAIVCCRLDCAVTMTGATAERNASRRSAASFIPSPGWLARQPSKDSHHLLIQLQRPRFARRFRVTTEFRCVARRTQVNDLAVCEGGPNSINAVQLRHPAQRRAEVRF